MPSKPKTKRKSKNDEAENGVVESLGDAVPSTQVDLKDVPDDASKSPEKTESESMESTKKKAKTSQPSPSTIDLDQCSTQEKCKVKEMVKLHLAGCTKPFNVKIVDKATDDEDSDDGFTDTTGLTKEEMNAKIMTKLEKDGLVRVTGTTTVKTYELTDEAIEKFTPTDYNTVDSKTNDELRNNIIKYSFHPELTKKIWTELEESGRTGMAKKGLVENLAIAGGSSNPNFFYSLDGLKGRGIVEERKQSLRLVKDAAFVVPPPQFEKSYQKKESDAMNETMDDNNQK